MGLPYQQALQQDLEYLAAAYTGYGEVLQACFGTGETDVLPAVTKDATGKPVKLTPEVFDIQFPEGKRPLRRKLN